MCAKSTYNPISRNYDETERLFCGFAPPSFDTRVESLPECPKTMSRSQKTTWQKKMKGRSQVLFNEY